MTQVCDFSSPQNLNIVAQHFTGIIRYVSDYPPKNITAFELNQALLLGLTVTLVCEQGNQPAMRGAAGGQHDAQIANDQADAAGYAEAATIYYVAEDPSQLPQSDWPTVVAYFEAVVANSKRPVGAYGGLPLTTHLMALGLVTKKWTVQTWGGTDAMTALEQLVGAPTYGLSVDADQVLQADYGQDPRPSQPPIGGNMAISPSFTHGGQKHVVQASASSVWHKWSPFGPGQNETLAGPSGGTAAGCGSNKVTVAGNQPGVTINGDGSVDITFEGADESAWLLSQVSGSSTWTGGKLA